MVKLLTGLILGLALVGAANSAEKDHKTKRHTVSKHHTGKLGTQHHTIKHHATGTKKHPNPTTTKKHHATGKGHAGRKGNDGKEDAKGPKKDGKGPKKNDGKKGGKDGKKNDDKKGSEGFKPAGGAIDHTKGNSNPKKPNVIVVMADDQDMLLDSLSVMPNVNRDIAGQGILYKKHYCTVAWCCPSRVNFLTGKMAHNTNITALSPPWGGWTKFAENGFNNDYLPVWISNAGIRTYYFGKLMNNFGVKNHNNPHPRGWDESSFLVDPWTYNYHHSQWTNGKSEKISKFPGQHTTHVTQVKALKAMDDAAKHGKQFFMMVAPVAPHVEIAGGVHQPPPPASFKGKFLDKKAPRRANWNPDKPSGASWVRELPRLTAKEVDTCDKNQVGRMQNIAGIDAMVGKMVDKLKDHNMLDNTYIIYTSDNGFHIGNHRLLPGKRCPYEEDINIPLLIRGPGVPQGVSSTITGSHTDMAPTILKMLGVPLRGDFDGKPLAYTRDTMSQAEKKPSEHVSVEFWDAGGKPDGYKGKKMKLYKNNSYKALRLISGGESFFYSVWCNGEREFYDMKDDFAQMNNRLAKNFKGGNKQYFDRPEKELYARLNAVLLVTKSCKQDSCRDPWGTLFPKNQVNGLKEAMKPEYDAFFSKQPKIKFQKCRKGFVASNEQPMHANAFGGK